ncbi:hypothetical protein [Marinospirillum minutulum]|uniref:hypothetical protein n=1 Tax=Marinospirillum minutulum TaxID=64974 RepID=UPI0004191670|nr:hypothetical protein [Marinospirillum minutulum]
MKFNRQAMRSALEEKAVESLPLALTELRDLMLTKASLNWVWNTRQHLVMRHKKSNKHKKMRSFKMPKKWSWNTDGLSARESFTVWFTDWQIIHTCATQLKRREMLALLEKTKHKILEGLSTGNKLIAIDIAGSSLEDFRALFDDPAATPELDDWIQYWHTKNLLKDTWVIEVITHALSLIIQNLSLFDERFPATQGKLLVPDEDEGEEDEPEFSLEVMEILKTTYTAGESQAINKLVELFNKYQQSV